MSCNLEEEYSRKKGYQEKMKISHVKFNELLKDNKFSKAYGKVQDKRSLVGKTVMEEQYNFTITNGLANVISNGNNVNYTLLINRINDEENSFENLIIKVDSLSQITAYIIKYKSDNVITPENFNLSSSAIQKHITPIIYNASSYSITGKEDAYDCYDVTVWVCSYAGHTLEGTCTHGEWATETICFASSGGSNDSGDSGAGSGPPLDMPNGGGGGGAPIGNNTPVGNPVNNCGSCNVPVYTAPVLEFEEEEQDSLSDFLENLTPLQLGYWNNLTRREKQNIADYLNRPNADPTLVNELMNLAIANDAIFQFDWSIDSSNTLVFNTVQDFENHLETNLATLEETDFEIDAQNQRIATAKFSYGTFGISIKVKQNMFPTYEIVNVSSIKTGLSILLSYEQTDYNVDIVGSYVNVDVYGLATTGIKITVPFEANITFENEVHFRLVIDKNTGHLITANEIND